MREQRVHDFAPAVNNVQHAFRQSGFFAAASTILNGRERNFFAGLEHESISAGDCDRIHPQRHHGGKIERRDAGAHAERLADGLAIDAARDVLQHFAHHQRRHAAARIRSLPCRVSRRRAIRPSVLPCSRVLLRMSVFEIVFQQHLELDRMRARSTGGVSHPRRKRGVRRLRQRRSLQRRRRRDIGQSPRRWTD